MQVPSIAELNKVPSFTQSSLNVEKIREPTHSDNPHEKWSLRILKRCCESPGAEVSTGTPEFSEDFTGEDSVEKSVGICWLSSSNRRNSLCPTTDEFLSFCWNYQNKCFCSQSIVHVTYLESSKQCGKSVSRGQGEVLSLDLWAGPKPCRGQGLWLSCPYCIASTWHSASIP